MIKKYSLVLVVLLCSFFYGYGQCLTDDFNSGYGNWTGSGTYQNGTAGVTGNGTGFNTTGDEIITNSILTNPQTLTLWLARSSSTANKTLSIQYSTSNSGPWTSARDILVGEVTTTHQEFTVNLNLTGDYYIRIAMTQRSGGSYYLDDIEVTCSASCTDTVNWNNLQFPATGTITVGGVYDVYARVNEPGVTDAVGPGANIETWIGFNASNTDPSTWAESDWYVASYSGDVSGNNDDEYLLDLGAQISSTGTYYYASRFRLNSCGFTYGGYNAGGGGTWDGTANVSGVLTVNPDVVDFCNLQSPATGNITVGGVYNAYARVFEPGVTPGGSPNIEAWIGYNSTNTNPNTWTNWVVATYNGQFGNDDEYIAEIGTSIPSAGTYYYASRFRLNGSDYSYGGITPPSGGNFWDGTTYISGVVTVTNPPNNATDFVGCFQDTSVDLTWTAPASGTTPDGYVIFAIAGGTAPTGAKLDAITYTANSDFSAAPTETPASLGKVVYKGAATAATVTGLTEGSNYSFAVFAYKNESSTGWSSGSVASRILNGLAQDDVRNLTSTPNNNQVTLNWLRPTPLSCWDEIVIFANQGAVTITPSGDGSAYTANSVYTTANQVVYKGGATSVAVTGLTNGTNYCFKAYVRRGTTWSDGIEICETPEVTYCNSTGNTTYRTGIRRVIFNTIDNATPIEFNDYSDFTAISTTVNLGEGYDLTVHVNTDGAFSLNTRVWIDWNNNGSFNDSGEEYDLGDAFDDPNAATTNSPLSVEVPITAAIGTTRMRVSTRYNAYSTSCQTGFDGEVEDYTINIQQPASAEINVKGANITIPSGFNAPYGLNNTLFAATNLGSSSAAKTYSIQNIGLANLNLTGTPIVEITGANAGDFAVTVQPSSTTLVSYAIQNFQIVFTPTADGTRTATVSISNNDVSGNENPYLFDIEGTGVCTTTITSNIWPIEGPVGTEITVTSVGNNLTGATAKLNDVTLIVLSSSNTELVLQLPNSVSDGNLVVTLSTGCSSTNSFDVLDTNIGGCDTGTSTTTPSDLFISEVTDATSGSSSYVEIYNGTGTNINLNDYALRIYNNGSLSPSSTLNLTGTLVNNAVHLVSIGTTSCALNNLSASPDQVFSGIGGINFDLNKADAIVLEKTSGSSQGEKDVFGEKGSGTWANGLSFVTDGVDFRRKNDAPILPTMTFDLTHWDIINWTTCADSDYVDVGYYDFSLGIPPNITLHPIPPVSSCDLTATLTVNATEGVVGGLALAYQWYVLEPNQTNWAAVTNGALYTGATTATLNILNTISLNNYQYYCQVRENSATCYQASNAIKLTVQTTEWDGTSWSNGVPNINTIATISGNYNTTTNGSFSACQLFVNATYTLRVEDNTYIEVQNDVTVDGTVLVLTRGSFVQRGDASSAGTYTNNGISTVFKTTAIFDYSISTYNYTYWSSPVINADVVSTFSNPVGNRRFYFQAENYLDATAETGNNNAALPGQDDIDDNDDDWQNASGIMNIGRGYAVTTVSGPPMAPWTYSDSADFIGEFNTGDVVVNVYKNDSEALDNNWNFIGNPYPSAIDAQLFLTENTTIIAANPTAPIDGAIFLWSQGTAADSNANGNEGFNFSQSDYAIINGLMGTAGGSGTAPDPYIPSGQGFFVSYDNGALAIDSSVNSDGHTISRNEVRFTNSMRVTGNNAQFFRVVLPNKLWLNLTSDNGVFSQIGLGYVSGATDGYDGMYYDAPRNLSTGAYSILYSIIEDSDKKFAIQGKDPSGLDLDEIIPLGFSTSINEATLYNISIDKLEGDFLTNNTIYLKDNVMNVTHNISDSDYTFTSDVGEFNERFEIVFNRETLSVGENELDPNDLTIIELNDTEVRFTVSNNFQIKSVEIIDLLGRTIYRLQGTSSSETYNLSNLSKSAYIAKVELSNGQIITKKAIKRH